MFKLIWTIVFHSLGRTVTNYEYDLTLDQCLRTKAALEQEHRVEVRCEPQTGLERK